MTWRARADRLLSVRAGNQRNDALNRRGSRSNSCPIIVAGDGTRNRQGLVLAEPFVSQEEEHLVLHEGAAEVHAEIITLEGRLGIGRSIGSHRRIEEITSVQIVVPEKLKQFAMVLVGSGTCGKVHDGAGIPAVLRGEGGVVDLVFSERIDRRLEGELVLDVVVQVDPVDQPIGRILALARRIDSE